MLPSPLLYLSAFFEASREEYYKQLYNLSSQGTWHEWFLYFLNGVTAQSIDALSRTERINTLITDWQLKVVGRSEGVIHEIVKYLAVNPYITTKKIADSMAIAFTTAQRAVGKLEELGILSQISKGKRNRVYCAKQILNILEEPTKITDNFKASF